MDELLRMENIIKVYPNGILANNDVSFSVERGEIHALIGENGAGKSTLMKILFGIESADKGFIFLKGKKIEISSPNVALENEIGMVHQHFMLVSSFTVAQNLVLGMEPKKGVFVDSEKAVKITEELSEKYNLHVDPKALVKDISVGTKQKVEILKALFRGAKILILDEPTAVLTPQETEELFIQLKLLKEKGHTIIFISHKLNELTAICDRVTIMRHGKALGVYNIKDVNEEDISRIMVGREVILKVEKEKSNPRENILGVKNLQYVNKAGKEKLKNISIGVRKGEIVGVAGVEGNGQKELVEIITGINKDFNGNVEINNQKINNLSIKQIRNLGTSHIPEDRMTQGVAGQANIEQNLISVKFDSSELHGKFLMKTQKIKNLAKSLVKEYTVLCNSPYQGVAMLSGGNIQKVVVARECSANPELLIANQPTRGIDVGATEFIRKRIVELRDEGTGVLLITADLNEVLELSDSLVVMYNGEITAYFEDASKITEEELGLYMLGIRKQSSEEIRRALNE
ncbi:ABC transporter ATP-binding protein [Vallitalea sediminicola]